MKTRLIKILLALLNGSFLNPSPCRYGFIGNVDAFSRENLESEEKQQPGITVKQILEEADRFKSCPIYKGGVAVIEGEEFREATVWDVHQLRTQVSETLQQQSGELNGRR